MRLCSCYPFLVCSVNCWHDKQTQNGKGWKQVSPINLFLLSSKSVFEIVISSVLIWRVFASALRWSRVSHEIGNADLQSRNLLMPKTSSLGGVSARIRCIKDCWCHELTSWSLCSLHICIRGHDELENIYLTTQHTFWVHSEYILLIYFRIFRKKSFWFVYIISCQ